MTPQELREDISVLNVVNFGGGAYVIYAEVLPNGEIEVDPEPYSDTFDRPARLLPIEAKALVAAIDLLNLAQPELGRGAREGRRGARARPGRGGPADHLADRRRRGRAHGRARRARQPPAASSSTGRPSRRFSRAPGRALRALQRHGGVVRRGLRPRQGPAPALPARPHQARHGARRALRAAREPQPDRRRRRLAADRQVEGSRIAHVWIAPEQARWAREKRTVVAELEDGAVVVEVPSRASTSSSRRSSRRRATPRCSSPPTPARPCSPPRAPASSLSRAQRPLDHEEVGLLGERAVILATNGRDGRA